MRRLLIVGGVAATVIGAGMATLSLLSKGQTFDPTWLSTGCLLIVVGLADLGIVALVTGLRN